MNDLVRLTTKSMLIINTLAALLEQNGIPTLIRNHNDSARLAGSGTLPNDVDLYVNPADLEPAQKLLREFEKEE